MTFGVRKRMRTAISRVAYEVHCIACCLVGRVKVAFFFDRRRVNRVELGATARREGFLNLDLDLRASVPYDLSAGLPFPDASIDFMYAEHVLEHLSHSEVSLLLGECRRVMKRGAVLSVSVPDAAIFLRGYADPQGFDRSKYCGEGGSLNYAARINVVNYMFYMDGYHRHMFDQESLLIALTDAGFAKVRRRSFDPALDQESRGHESIYAECVKV